MIAYEPGSTVKTMTVSYALDQALVDPERTILSVTVVRPMRTTVLLFPATVCMVNLDLTGGIAHSCNDVMMQLSDRIGAACFIADAETVWTSVS